MFLTACTQNNESVITNLRCDFLTNPMGIDDTSPRLSWEIENNARGVIQQAYRILVASSPEKLKDNQGDLWDSGKIRSDSSANIYYSGRLLDSRMDCYWKVEVWTNKENNGSWSKPARWSIGLLHLSDWSAHWTGLDTFSVDDSPHVTHTRLSARYFRKTFRTDKSIKKAVVYISGLGEYELYINGKKTGDAVLSPSPTEYDKRVLYNTYDVTRQIRKGENAIGTILGNGRFFTMRWEGAKFIPPVANFGYPKMRLQLEITYDDGSVQKVLSDDSWKVTMKGPILSNNEYDGEDYDARKEMPGWSKPDFDDSQWMPAQLVAAPCKDIASQMNPLIRVMDSVKPKAVFEIAPGKFIYDMGQNMVGWAHLKIKDGKTGDTVMMRFAEKLKADSSLYTANLRSAEATDHYIMKEGRQQWEPHFTYHGFRYIEVTGYPGVPDLSDIVGKVVYDDLETTGHFETSNTVINQVYHNAYRGIRGNYRGMPTDCPQRDERMAWLGDHAVVSYGESFIFGNNTLYAKWLQDIEDAQLENGSLPDLAPSYWKFYTDNMTYPGAYIIIANTLYHQFANLKPIKKHYPSMKKWLYYMRDKYMKDYIMTKDTYGDWCMPPEDPKLIHSEDPARQTAGDYIGTAYYYHMLQLMEHFATLLHKPKDQQEFSGLAANVKQAFNKKYLDTVNDEYSNNTVTANILALSFHLAPDSIRPKIFEHAVSKTMKDFNGHISTGIIGAKWLMRCFSRNGRPDIAYKLATNTTYPSWGYMAKKGATTTWELWNGNTANPAMNSGNHIMLLGDLIIWFYEDLAGIKSDNIQTGFKKIVMNPLLISGLSYVNASYHSVHGLIKSNWKTKNGVFSWKITIPANTTADISIPANHTDNITESGKKVTEVEGVKFVEQAGDRAVFQIGSGTYDFVSKNMNSAE
jgi:alpha-L-rhamnosidase